MYLTKIILSRKNYFDLRIKDDYSIHRIVYDLFAFPGCQRFLYVDKGYRDGFNTVLVLSPHEPKGQSDIRLETKVVSPSFLLKGTYGFEIVLNPVKRNNSTKKLEPIIGQLPLLNWFIQKCEKNGFSVDEKQLTAKTLNTQVITGKQQDFPQNKAVFTGVLTVTNQELFEKAFFSGIGKSKAFGFGMLQLIPLKKESLSS